ncbi:hypothetical protein Hypma_004164 [Hypsizygus marmoreus]|uniref:Uncharacterized protein n=1 Tax=Hypsizygus marmoreus TaxID=39966 RepID=A0A369J4E5_HYPMA|nr:hypothetical protein Hypma_004164 [Hypsizygus marmoreus]
MGRRAKYFTQDEKGVGTRTRKKIYASSPRCQALRTAQNQRAYQIRRETAVPQVAVPVLPVPVLSAELLALADMPTPHSRIFHQVCQSSDALDETDYADSELKKWDCSPPYTLLLPRHPDKLYDALQGYRTRLQREEEIRRLHRYETERLDIFATEVHAELVSHYNRWEELRDMLGNISEEGVDGQMGRELLRWEARRVFQLEKDLAALRQGSDTFLCLYVNRWS